MSQDIIRHPFLNNKPSTKRLLVEWARDVFVEHASQIVGDYVLSCVEEVLNPPSDTTGYYTDAFGNVWQRNELIFLAGEDDAGFGDMTDEELMASLRFVKPPFGAPDNAADVTRRVLDELLAREIAESIVQRDLEAKIEQQRSQMISHDARMRGTPEILACAFAESMDWVYMRKWLSKGTRAFFRRCLKTSSDGTRVSREVHEYDYCVKSGQLQFMLDAVGSWGVNFNAPLFESLSDVGVSQVASDYTYGNFVDMHFGRKAIAAIRKVRRSMRRANVKSTLELSGTEIDQLATQIIGNLDFADAYSELVALNVTGN